MARTNTNTGGSGGLINALNGLTVIGTTVYLGGSLTGDTTIDGDSQSYELDFQNLASFSILNTANLYVGNVDYAHIDGLNTLELNTLHSAIIGDVLAVTGNTRWQLDNDSQFIDSYANYYHINNTTGSIYSAIDPGDQTNIVFNPDTGIPLMENFWGVGTTGYSRFFGGLGLRPLSTAQAGGDYSLTNEESGVIMIPTTTQVQCVLPPTPYDGQMVMIQVQTDGSHNPDVQVIAGGVAIGGPSNYSYQLKSLRQPNAQGCMILQWNVSANYWSILAENSSAVTSTTPPVQQIFTSSGTYTPSYNLSYAIVELQAAGGSPGSPPATGVAQVSAASASSSGAYAKVRFTPAELGSSVSFVLGGPGLGATGTDGSDAAQSTFGTFITCPGGKKGRAGTVGTTSKAQGANSVSSPTITTGAVLATRDTGIGGNAAATVLGGLGICGGAPASGLAPTSTASIMFNGVSPFIGPTGYGAGATGATITTGSTSATSGPAGGQPVLIITEFY